MATLNFHILNVFTRGQERLSGNPLCVFERADALDGPTMQALARQFNLSETTFILSSQKANARVRIFTPDFEMPFAGHPTLGTAHMCRALGLAGDELKLEMQAGVIPVRARGDRWTLDALSLTWREVTESRAEMAAMLGLGPQEVVDRPLWVKSGKEQLVIPLASASAVERARPAADMFDRMRNDEERGMAYVFAPTGGRRIQARFFFPSGRSIIEDPATGSATANFGGWWIAMKRELPCALTISQGEQIHRPSELVLEIDAQQGIHVSGNVVVLARGTLEL